jgi:Isochorismatase family
MQYTSVYNPLSLNLCHIIRHHLTHNSIWTYLQWKYATKERLIFFTSIQMLSKRFESSANIYTLGKLGFDRLFGQFTAEDMDFTIKPKQDEIVINKHTASIFIDTGFERMLRNAGIITIVFRTICFYAFLQYLKISRYHS